MMDLPILLCIVVYTFTWAMPAQSTVKRPRDHDAEDDHVIIRSEMTATDQIMEANDFQAVQVPEDGARLRDGDIAVSKGPHSNSCFARSCLWPKSVDGHVYIAYRLSPEYSDLDKNVIRTGMEAVEQGTCVRFRPWTHQRDYLDFQPKSGCWSYLGYHGGRQSVSLQSPECMWSGVTSHELMHALGFVHEQSRADRDQYVAILWSNILKDRTRNFEKFKTNNLDLPYDYNSIMHFGRYAYSEDGDPTIVAKRRVNIQMGQRSAPSQLDKMKINRLYNCDADTVAY